MALNWVGGRSRVNDRSFTTLVVGDAIRTCRHHDFQAAVPAVGFALDCVAALHRDATGWAEHVDTEAAWRVLRQCAVWEAPVQHAFTAMKLTAERLELLRRRLVQADEDERLLAEYEQAMSSEGA